MVEALDQSAIDQIVAAAEEETPEGKIAKLEKEIELLKGSIKRLLMDIRETMNNLENPFQSLQNLAEVVGPAAKPSQVQILPPPPAPPESVKNEEEVVEEDKGKEEELVEKEVDKNVSPSSIFKEDKSSEAINDKNREVMKKEEVEFKEEVGLFTKMDLATLLNLMEWVSNMLKKYDQDTLKRLMDIFEYVGYISPETKDFIVKVIDVSSVVDGSNLEEMILDLYRLHKIMNPSDTSMDSKILLLLLNRKLGSGSLNW